MNSQDPQPADFLLNAALTTGASASQVNAALTSKLSGFIASLQIQDANEALSKARNFIPSLEPVMTVSETSMPLPAFAMDPGYQDPIEQGPGTPLIQAIATNGGPWFPVIGGGNGSPFTITVAGGFLSIDGTLGNLATITGLGSAIDWSGSEQYFVLNATGINYESNPSDPVSGASVSLETGDSAGYDPSAAPWVGNGNVSGTAVPSVLGAYYQTAAIYPLLKVTAAGDGSPIITMIAFSNLQWGFTSFKASPAAYPQPF